MIAFGLPMGWEWLIILAVAVLLFGHRLPGIARSAGSSIMNFKKGLREGEDPQKLPPPEEEESE